jgi:single-strand DNA-binding protein
LKEATEWHRVVLYRRLAEIANQYLQKGAHIYVEGRLRTRKWTDKSGAERFTTEIEADELKMLGKKSDQTFMPSNLPRETPSVTAQKYVPDDTIPF